MQKRETKILGNYSQLIALKTAKELDMNRET
jgi:hypothetical protein